MGILNKLIDDSKSVPQNIYYKTINNKPLTIESEKEALTNSRMSYYFAREYIPESDIKALSLREYLINPGNWEDVLYPTITTDFYNDIDEVEKNLQFPDMLGEVLETDKEIDFSKCYTYGFAPKLEPICNNFVVNIILNESGDKIVTWIMSQD